MAKSGDTSIPTVASSSTTNRKVCYFYDKIFGKYYYGSNHPMKPHRILLTHLLLKHYNLLPHLTVFVPNPASVSDLERFHDPNYISFLRAVTPSNLEFVDQAFCRRYNVGVEDCPVFDGLFEFCQSSAGGSIGAAKKLNEGSFDIAINWAGGLHHAKKGTASGFCYVNDIVLAILELLKCHKRVLYVDIDIHHGDGVEEAFYTTDRVMTVSFHRYGDGYFPKSGGTNEIGVEKGKYYSVNVPFMEGIDDESYHYIFKPIMTKVMEVYRPGVVVLQCGADSVFGDKLGGCNLSVRGHGECVKFMMSFDVPMLLLGGGGYRPPNVARCWCYETAIALGLEVDNNIPQHDYYDYYAPCHTLFAGASKMKNQNSHKNLNELISEVLDNLSKLTNAPITQFEKTPDTESTEEAKPAVKGKAEDTDNMVD